MRACVVKKKFHSAPRHLVNWSTVLWWRQHHACNTSDPSRQRTDFGPKPASEFCDCWDRFFGSTRAASPFFRPDRQISQLPCAGPVKAGRVFRGRPKGLALIGPAQGSLLDRIGLQAIAELSAISNRWL